MAPGLWVRKRHMTVFNEPRMTSSFRDNIYRHIYLCLFILSRKLESNEECKDQESIQSSTITELRHHKEK